MTVSLSDFVAEAIVEISRGVHLAKSELHELVAVSPGSMNGNSVLEKSYIEFDVAVTASMEKAHSSSKSGKAGAGITVLSARIGVDGNLSSESSDTSGSEMTSRISFAVPVYFNAHFRNDPSAVEEAKFVKRRFGNKDEKTV